MSLILWPATRCRSVSLLTISTHLCLWTFIWFVGCTKAVADQPNRVGFRFLAPLASTELPAGILDLDVSPVVIVCRWVGTKCDGTPVATFRRDAPAPQHIRVAGNSYLALWDTGSRKIEAGHTYRTPVAVGAGIELGHADVLVLPRHMVSSDSDLLAIQSGAVVPIRFQIQPGAAATARTVAIVGDPDRTVRGLITPETGGTLVAWATDDTRFTLAIPPAAVSQNTEIAIEPIDTITGLTSSGPFVAGIRFFPFGLTLLRGASLTIERPQTDSRSNLRAFEFVADGAAFHLSPTVPKLAAYAMSIAHFSGAGLKEKSAADCVDASAITPVTEEIAKEVITCALDAPDAEPTIVAELSAWFEDVVVAALVAVQEATQFSVLQAAINQYVTWQALVNFLDGVIDTGPLDADALRGDALIADAFGNIQNKVETSCRAAAELIEKRPLFNELLFGQGLISSIAGIAPSVSQYERVLGTLCGGAFAVAQIDLVPNELTVKERAQASVSATLRNDRGIELTGEEYRLNWSILSDDIAAITGNGRSATVTGIRAGRTQLTVYETGYLSIGTSATAAVTIVPDVAGDIAGIELTPLSALLRNDGTELPLTWQFTNKEGKPVPSPEGASATWSVNRVGILTVEKRDLQHAVAKGVAPGRTAVTVAATYSGGTLRATATIDVFEERIYRFSSSSITTTGVSRGELYYCAADGNCDWRAFSCTFVVDSIFDPASAVRVMTRPLNDVNNFTSVVLDGGLGGGSALRVIVSERGHELAREGEGCLAPDAYENEIIPFATRTTAFGEPVYPMSGTGLVWQSGISHVTSWIGGLEGSPTNGTQVRFFWPIDVTEESLTVRTERSWNFALPGGSDFYRDLSWSSAVTGQFKLVREK